MQPLFSCILALCLFSGNFIKKLNTECRQHSYGNFDDHEEALNACSVDNFCQGVYEKRCNEKEWKLCKNGATYKSGNGCIYQKIEGKL